MDNIARTAVGLASLGRPAYINLGRESELPADRTVAAMRDATFAVLDRAYDAGVRRVDVARSYGRAEEFLAAWLSDRGRSDVTVSSKWGYAYVGDWRTDAPVHEVKEHSLARFRQQWAETRDTLPTAPALYQVHSLTPDSALFDDRELQVALAELVDTGVRVGFSTSGPAQADTIRRALELTVDGRHLFTAVQSTWNVLESSAGLALAEAHRAGVLVQLKETLANGRLAVDPPDVVADIARAHGTTPDVVALAAAYAEDWADVVLLGPAGVTQLDTNLAAAALRLNDDDLENLAELRENPREYWARRSQLVWE
ncbi:MULTISPECIES: aldo/keto reductase [Prauserella salsuginis group]|uniref:Aryl-alcohol dehydrogenase-like predicted oxidoreductase n=2 Tax=Prauserella salsuginis group TaxID=2893672 RepID=A0A839XU59_9PSEU|nr:MULTISPECIES: aldo/keto reductase [Prauserella salsuginis group]MBB3666261.1 aryl-alcohol dehydrogenase-like predicted oxidoreductase [Prauserella sediminis]MCR3718219.1 putative oxidoreductase [Prauserella flava]MCR3732789.1 putative oxidoreductase [Prauserella salsuginis]